MFTTRSGVTVCAHQPAQLDEEAVRVELFHALGRLLAARAHATQEPSDPSRAWTDESLCLKPVVHQAVDRHRAEAQDV